MMPRHLLTAALALLALTACEPGPDTGAQANAIRGGHAPDAAHEPAVLDCEAEVDACMEAAEDDAEACLDALEACEGDMPDDDGDWNDDGDWDDDEGPGEACGDDVCGEALDLCLEAAADEDDEATCFAGAEACSVGLGADLGVEEGWADDAGEDDPAEAACFAPLDACLAASEDPEACFEAVDACLAALDDDEGDEGDEGDDEDDGHHRG